jgi:uncharacterized membrane-anchored protein
MSFARPRLVRQFLRAFLVVISGVALSGPVAEAREGARRPQHELSTVEIQRPSRRGYDDIIVEMEPLHPWRGATVAKPAEAAAKLAKPAAVPAPVNQATPETATKAPEPAPAESAAKAPDAAPTPAKEAAPALDSKAADAGAKDAAQVAPGEPTAKDVAAKDAGVKAPELLVDAKGAADPSAPVAAAAPESKAAISSAAPASAPAANSVAAAPPVAQKEGAPVPAPESNGKPVAQGGADQQGPVLLSPKAPVQDAAKADISVQPASDALKPAVVDAAKPGVADASKPAVAGPVAPLAFQPQPNVTEQAAGVQSPAAVASNPAPLAEKPAVAQDASAPASKEAPAPKAAAPVSAQNDEEKAYSALLAQGVKGPAEVRLADRATMWLPAGHVYLEAEHARKLLGVERGSWDDATQGVVLPVAGGPQWMAYVDLLDDGYIKDEEGKSLDANSLLASYKAGVASQNPGRIRLGLTPLEITGWLEAPRYDEKHRLNSCIGATAQGSQSPDDRIVNCTSFALGRQGAMKIVVAGDETAFARFKGEAATLAETIVYDKGKGYEDADLSMDKVAGYSLVGLLTGAVALKKLAGAAAAAVVAKKAGLLAVLAVKALKLWKLLLAGFAFIVMAIRWVVSKFRPAKPESDEEQPVKPVSKPIWTRIAEAVRAKFGASRKEADLGSANAESVPAQAEEPLQQPALATESGSLFASLRQKLSSVRLFRKGAAEEGQDKAEATAVAAVAPEIAGVNAEAVAPQSPGSALAKLASLMRKQAAQPAGRSAESASDAPASPLAKLAARMRNEAEQPTQPVDLSRATARRGASAAATAVASAAAVAATAKPLVEEAPEAPAPVAPEPVAVAAPAVAAPIAAAETGVASDDPIGLVEPGDEAAASLAISAREALRESRG